MNYGGNYFKHFNKSFCQKIRFLLEVFAKKDVEELKGLEGYWKVGNKKRVKNWDRGLEIRNQMFLGEHKGNSKIINDGGKIYFN
jgi:hypothetical protein